MGPPGTKAGAFGGPILGITVFIVNRQKPPVNSEAGIARHLLFYAYKTNERQGFFPQKSNSHKEFTQK